MGYNGYFQFQDKVSLKQAPGGNEENTIFQCPFNHEPTETALPRITGANFTHADKRRGNVEGIRP